VISFIVITDKQSLREKGERANKKAGHSDEQGRRSADIVVTT